MTIDEVRRLLAITPQHAMLVDLQPAPGCPGYVRTVELFEDLRVCISFEVYGYDEGGAYFWGRYPGLSEACADLEAYLATPLEAWVNHYATGFYPPRPFDLAAQLQVGHPALRSAIRSSSVALPGGTRYVLRGWYDRPGDE